MNDADRFSRDRLLRLIGRGADMMRAVHTSFVSDWISEFRHRRSRLNRKHVQAGANSFRLKRFDQRRLIDNFTARSVDKVSAVAHLFEKVGANQQPCVRLERHVYAHDVRGAGDGERGFHSFHA